jgi:hypothetical protein
LSCSEVHARETKGGGEKTCRLRRQIKPCRIGSADDSGQAQQCFSAEAKFLDHDIEGAKVATMAPVGVFNVEGGGVETVGNSRHFLRSHKKEYGGGINKAPDEPGAGDAVDFGSFAGHPKSAVPGIALGDFCHGTSGSFALSHSTKPPSSDMASAPSWRSHAAVPSLSFAP